MENALADEKSIPMKKPILNFYQRQAMRDIPDTTYAAWQRLGLAILHFRREIQRGLDRDRNYILKVLGK